jgi:hypothetical protein
MPSDNMTWGAVPAGFSKIADDRGNRLIVRQDRQNVIDLSVCTATIGIQNDIRYEGRGPLRAIRLTGGDTALVRPYRHGGLFRHLSQDCFFSWPPRPFRELSITEELRRRGIRTVEVYAACVSRVCGPVYRGWLVTRELRDAQDLWAALRSDFVQRAGLTAILRALAITLRALHREGVYHSDLNMKNLLVRLEPEGVAGYVIDFDKARLFLGALPPALVNKNLSRLLRSVRKLDPERKYFSVSAWDDFMSIYHEPSDA